MCAPPAPGVLRPVGVLLGGSGRVRAPIPPQPHLAALLRPTGLTTCADKSHPVARACPAEA